MLPTMESYVKNSNATSHCVPSSHCQKTLQTVMPPSLSPALKHYEQRVHTMDQLMVSFQRWAGSADEDINLFLVGGKNYSWQLHEGHDGKLMVSALKLDLSLDQDTK